MGVQPSSSRVAALDAARSVAQAVPSHRAETANEERKVEKEPLDLVDVGASDVPGQLMSITCPECGGAIWQDEEYGGTQFRCHIGHAYSVESFLAQHGASVEAALWTAIRVLEERVTIARGVAARMTRNHHPLTAEQFEDQAQEAAQHADRLRRVAANLNPFPEISERAIATRGD